MKVVSRAVWGIFLALAAAAAPAVAQQVAPDQFHVTYQYKDLSASNGKIAGKAILTVLNLSGKPAKDVSLAAGPEVTFDQSEVRLGDIANGLQSHQIAFIDAPGEVPNPLPDFVQVTVRFTDELGVPGEATVSARRVP